MADPLGFRQKGTDISRGFQSEAPDADPSEESGFAANIGIPVWRQFVNNEGFQKAFKGAIDAEKSYQSQMASENRSSSSGGSWKGVDGKVSRLNRGIPEEYDAESLIDHPELGGVARKSVWDRDVNSAKRESEEASFRLKDPAFHARGLAKKDREAIEAEGSMLAETDPRHIELKAKLVADTEYQTEKSALAQKSWDAQDRARQIEATDPDSWLAQRNQPTAQEQRAQTVATAQAQRSEVDMVEESAARRDAELQAKLAAGMPGPEAVAAQAERAEIANARGLAAQKRVESEAPIKAVQEAAKKEKDFFNVGDTVSGIWDAVKGLGTTAPAAFYQLVEGMERPDQYSDSAKKAFAEADAFNKEMQAKTDANQAAGTSSSVGESFREAGGSLGFSIGSMAAAIPSSIAGAKGGAIAGGAIGGAIGAPAAGVGAAPGAAIGASIGGTIGGISAGMAASGTAAYRMAGASFLNESWQQLQAESQKKSGRPMNEAEMQSAYDALIPIAQNTALWEAGPEAVGNAVTMGAGQIIFGLGKGLAKKFAGSIGAKVVAGSGSLATELATETMTQVEQGADQKKAQAIAQGQDPNAIKADWSAGNIVEAFKEVAPQTLALMGLMGGAGGALKLASKALPSGTPADSAGDKPRIDTALQAIDPEAPAPTSEEVARAALFTSANMGVEGVADGVLIERELVGVETADAETLAQAQSALNEAQTTGGDVKAAEALVAQARVATGRAPLTRAVLKVAAGLPLDNLTTAELEAVGYKAGEGSFTEMSPKEREAAGVPAQMLVPGHNNAPILTDAALAQVEAASPRARARITMDEAQARAKALSTPATPAATPGTPQFEVEFSSGKKITVSAATEAEARKAAAGHPDASYMDRVMGAVAIPSNEPNPTRNPATPQVPLSPLPTGTPPSTNPLAPSGGVAGAVPAQAQAQAPVAPASPAEMEADQYEAARAADPTIPPIADTVIQAFAEGRPVSVSMVDKAGGFMADGSGIQTPSGYTRQGNMMVPPTTPPVAGGTTAPGPSLTRAKARIAELKAGSKQLADAIVDNGARGEMQGGKINVNPDLIIQEALDAGLTEEQAIVRFNAVLDEEISHLAQTRSAVTIWKEQGSPGDFNVWFEEHYGNTIWQGEFVAKGKSEIVRGLYTGTTAADRKAWDGMDAAGKAASAAMPKYSGLAAWDVMPDANKALEGIRVMKQRWSGKSATEAARLWTDISQTLYHELKVLLAQLKILVRKGNLSPALQQEIEHLDAALKQFAPRNPKADPKKPAPGKTGDGTGKPPGSGSGTGGNGRVEPTGRDGAGAALVEGQQVVVTKDGVRYEGIVSSYNGVVVNPNNGGFNLIIEGRPKKAFFLDQVMIEVVGTPPAAVAPEAESENPDKLPNIDPGSVIPAMTETNEDRMTIHELRREGKGFKLTTSRRATGEVVKVESFDTLEDAREALAFYKMLNGVVVDAVGDSASFEGVKSFTLPEYLKKSSPRYGYGSKNFTLEFASDYDKAAYILANDATKASAAAEGFRQALASAGLNAADAVAHGNKVKAAIKELAKNAREAGELKIPSQPTAAAPTGQSDPGVAPDSDIDKFSNAYSAFHLSRIAREAKSGKQSAEYYDRQRAEWTPEKVRDRVAEFLKVIDSKDVANLVRYNNGMFDGFWKLFGIRTGMHPMPKTQTGIADHIRSYVGNEAYDAHTAELEAARAKSAEESAAKDEKNRINGLKADAARVTFQGGQNGQEWVDEVLADGWRVTNISNGPIPKYAFTKGNQQKGFGDNKQAKPLIAYAREAQKEMADPVDEDAAREDAEFAALPQEEQDAVESLFTPGGTKPLTPAAESPTAPALTPAEEQAKNDLFDAFDGLVDGLQSATLLPADFYRERPPADRLPQFQKAAQSLISAGVDTPQKLAGFLEKISPGKLRAYSEFLWRQVNSFLMGDETSTEWGGVYAEMDKPAETPSEASDFTSAKGNVLKSVSNNTRDLLLAGETVTVDRIKSAEPLSSTLTRKELDEAIEAGITAAAYRMVGRVEDYADGTDNVQERTFSALVRLYDRQPSLNAKTSTSKINQAYSTPSPLAYVASRLADIAGGKVLTEPTGGHGMLMMESTADQVVQFNEIDAARHERTRLAIPESSGWKMTSDDATSWTPAQAPDRIAANPPFGSVMAEDGTNIAYFTAAGKTTSIDHAIMLKQLGSMTPDGRAVFIIGGPDKTARSEAARKEHYGRGAKAAFFKHLHDNFGVVDHFTVDGDLYAKQGAGWNVDVIVIQGRKASRTSLPSAKAPRMLATWDDVFQTTQLTDEQRIQLNRLSEEEVRDSVRGMVDALAGIGNVGRPQISSSRPESSGGQDGTGGTTRDTVSSESSETESGDNQGTGGVGGERDGVVGDQPAGVEQGTEPSGEDSGTRGSSDPSGNPAGTVRTPVKESGKFQAEYTPFSGEKGLDTLLPRNMVGPVADAFARIKRDLGGNLTKFVHEKLGYPEGVDITQYLAGEQIDAVAAAIWNFERGGALIVGDQTGIGKGRIAAALMKYAVNQGYIPVFMTKDSGLHDAMLTEDLPDIAAPEIIPAVMDTQLQFTSAKKQKLDYGQEYFNEAASARSLPGKSNAIFVTYSQIQADDAKGLTKRDRATARNAGEPPADNWRMRTLRRLAPNAVFILDESHLASGQSTTGWRVADIIGRSPRVYYSSATSVKRPENMGIYFKTNVGMLTNGNMADLTDLMNRGGVPAMQVVSSMLAQDGQYLRRERSFDGVSFTTQIAEESSERDRDLADALTGSLREIVTVQDAMRQAAEAINSVIAAAGRRMSVPAANRAKLETVNFSSKLHNIVGQYLLAIKTQSAADTAIREIRAGKKVVVALQSTMESAIDALETGGFEMSYKGLVLRYLDQMRFLTSGNRAFGRGEVETFEVTEDGLPEFEELSSRELEARIVSTSRDPETGDTIILINEDVAAELMRRSMWDVFVNAREQIEKADLGDLPLSPIDAMRQAVEREGIRTGEITGRKRGIDADGEIYARSAQDTSKPARRVVQSAFNNEDLDFLVINQSGSTGISLHASEKAKNQATRVMVVAQPNLDINEFMQTLGRIHRSGQVVKPEFILLQTALPAEKRPAAILGKKMSMLNANTTSNAKTDVSEGNTAVDIFNQYGDEVAYRVFERDPDLQRQLRPLGSSLAKFFDKLTGNALSFQDAQGAVEDQPAGYIARTITGYLAILPVEEQEIFWEKTIADYQAYISYLDQIGSNALEAKALDLQAKTISSETFTEKAEGESAFSAPSFIETVETKIGKEPLTGDAAVSLSQKVKSGSKETLQKYLSDADAAANEHADQKAKKAIKKWDDEKRAEFLSNQRAQRNAIANAISLVGRFGSVSRSDGNSGVGVIEKILIDPAHLLTPSKQIAIIRVNDSREALRIPVTQLGEAFTPSPNESAKEWSDSLDIGGQSSIATGNLMAAMKALGGTGKVITYTTESGEDRMGILLPKSFTMQREAAKSRVRIDTAEKLLSALDAGIPVTNSDSSIKWTKGSSIASLSVPASRARGGDIWRNPTLNRMALGGEFTQVGNDMRATFNLSDVPAVFKFLTDSGETFSSEKPKGAVVSDDTEAFGRFIDDREGRGLHSAPLRADSPEWKAMSKGERMEALKAAKQNNEISDGQADFEAADSPGNVLGTTYETIPLDSLPEWGKQAVAAAQKAAGRGRDISAVQLSIEDRPGKSGDMEFAKSLLSVFRKRVRFVKATDGKPLPFDGMVSTSDLNTLILDADSRQGTFYLIGHELGHSIQHQQPELYDKLQAAVLDMASDWSDYNARLAKVKDYDTQEKRDAEFTNDFIGSQMLEPKFWRNLQERDSSTFRKVLDLALEFLAAIGTKIGVLQRDVRPYFKDIEAAREVLADALLEYRKGNMSDASVRKSIGKSPDAEYSSQALHSATLPKANSFPRGVPSAFTEEARDHQQASGRNLTHERAGFGSAANRDQLDVVTAYYDTINDIQTNADNLKEARRMLASNPKDIDAKLKGAATDKTFQLTPADHVAMQLRINQLTEQAGDNAELQAENGARMLAYRIMRGDVARVLQIGWDRDLKPAERALAALTESIYMPSKKIQKTIASLPLSERKAAITKAAEARIAKVTEELAKINLKLSDITKENEKLKLANSKLMKDVQKSRPKIQQNVLKMIQQGASLEDIKRRLGISAEEAQKINRDAREDLRAKIAPMVAAGMSMEEIVKQLNSLQSAPLGAGKPLTPEQVAAEVERILTIGFGLPEEVRAKNIKPKKVTKTKPVNVMEADWSRPDFKDNMDDWTFDTKDRANIMQRVEIIRGLAGAIGKIGSLDAGQQVKAMAAVAEINTILAKYGTDVKDIFESSQSVESYGFDINDINHVGAVARMISTMDADFVDKSTELVYANMLSGLQTMLVNATAILPATWEVTVGRAYDLAVNAVVKDPMSAQLGESQYILKAFKPAWLRAMSNFKAAFISQHPMFDRDVLAHEIDWDKILGGGGYRINGSISGKKGDIIRMPMRLLAATDDFNRTLMACVEVGTFAFRIAKARGMKPGTPEFDQFLKSEVNTPGSPSYLLAANKASRAIFSNPLPSQKDPTTGKKIEVRDLGDVVGYAAASLNKFAAQEHDNIFAKAALAIVRVSFFPFQRTPFNILRKGVRHTLNPFSVFDILLGTYQNSRKDNLDGTKSWKWNANGRNAELVERVGQQLQGATLMLILAAMTAGEGDDDDQDKPFIITGSSPFTPRGRAERETQMRSGVGPYRISFRKDGKERFGISYGRFEPIATTLAATIDLMKSVKRSNRAGGDSSQAAAAALGGFAAQAQDKSFMKGISDLISLGTNILAEPDVKDNRKFQQFLASRFSMVFPNLIKQPIREMDANFRERSDSFMQEVLYQVVPAGQKPAKLDPYGDKVMKTGNAAGRIIDMTEMGTDTVNPVDSMLLRFRDKHPDKAWFPSSITTAEFVNKRTGKPQKMTGEQLTTFRELSGKLTKALLKNQFINYNNPTEADVKKVKSAYEQAKSKTKDSLAFRFSK